MGLLVVDVETYSTDPKNGKLLGIAICDLEKYSEEYHVLQWYDYRSSTWFKHPNYEAVCDKLKAILISNDLIGHNYSFDKNWIDYWFGISTNWHACTRLMWHMASAPSGPRPYGLKDAQIEVLGWDSKGSTELQEQVESRGGLLRNGDHYLADVSVISKYACLDASSTAMIYNHFKPFFDQFEYWWMLEKMVKYSWLLQTNTEAGILVDEKELKHQIEVLGNTKEAYSSQFMELAHKEIARLERMWLEDRAAKYTFDHARVRFLRSWDMHKKFKLSSDKDKRELFYDVMKLPIMAETEGGKGSTGVDAIKLSINGKEEYNELMEAYEQAELSETLLNNFAKPWASAVINSRLHPRFNPCGTVSYRLSGFKPYLLNAPFEEKELMSCLKCDEGWIGVHADFNSIEPCITAHYSQDPGLLKVFKEGRGDVYLDLALSLFPNDKELHEGYNPNEAISSHIKERFKNQRKIAKIIQLAVQYTGTKFTVAKNLNNSGFPLTLSEGADLVNRYWDHYRKVAIMNEALFIRFSKQGYLRNVVGRVIRVPTHVNIRKKDGTIWEKPIDRYKDLPNRFIQSSAHDLLSFWVLVIYEMAYSRGINIKPVILDCHDSTSNQCPIEQVEALEQVYLDALTELNKNIKMSVPIKIEMKRFETLAGLKGD